MVFSVRFKQRWSWLFAHSSIWMADPKLFLEHPIIAAVRAARVREMQDVIATGGREDAFGRWIALAPTQKGRKAARSVLAQVAQSFELRIMSAALPILQADGDLRLFSWFHDGITLHSTDSKRAERKYATIKAAVELEAQLLNIPARIEDDV